MRSGRSVAAAVAIGGCLIASCGPPSPGGHDLEIIVNGNVQFATNLGLDSYAWDTKPIDLGIVPTFTLENNTVGVIFRDVQETTAAVFPNNPLCVPSPRNRCLQPFTLRRIPELHLFERSPRDVYFALMTDPFDNPWATNIAGPTFGGINGAPFELPADVVIPYGGNSFISNYPAYVSVQAFSEQDFLRQQNGGATLLSQWQQPSSGGLPNPLKSTSIKAARLVTLPECSASVNVQNDIFSQLGGLVNSFPCDLGVQANIVAASYLTHQDPTETNLETALTDLITPWNGVFGGVMLNGFVFVPSQAGAEQCSVFFTYDLRYALAQPCDPTDVVCKVNGTNANKLVDHDGILTVQPIRVRLEATQSLACQHDQVFLGWLPQVEPLLQQLFEVQLPQIFYRQAYARQGIPAAPVTDPNIIHQFQCDAGEIAPVEDQCGNAMNALGLAVSAGATKLGLPNANAVFASIHDPRNWTCRYATKDEVGADCSTSAYSGGRCQFELPASSVIAEPDEVRLAWAGLNELLAPPTPCATDKDCSTIPPNRCGALNHTCEVNPSSAAFVAAFEGNPTDFQALCTPPTSVNASQPYYQRYFASLDAHVCAPGPPPPTPPCPVGLTACNGACVDVNTDFNHCGNCTTQCPAGNGLTYGGFMCQAGTCTPALSCACSQDINCVDIMGNGARCTNGQCVP